MTGKNTAGFFDRYAAEFDAIYSGERNSLTRLIDHLFRKSMRLRFERTLRDCSPIQGRTVIDIGCGSGRYSVALALMGARRVCGVDFSPAMTELARSRAEKCGVADRCEFIVSDFESFETNERFDIGIAMGFMDYIEAPEFVLSKVTSLVTDTAFFSFPSDAGFLAWQRRRRYRSKCDLYMYNLSQLQRLFTACGGSGFEIEKMHRDFFATLTI